MLRDDIDRSIVAHLVEDGRASFAEIGERVGLSAPAVKRRVDRLQADGVILAFTALVDLHGGGAGLDAFVELYCRGRTNPDEILATVSSLPQVVAAYTVTGDADALLRVRTADTSELEVVLERIRAEEKVERTKSVIVLSCLVERPSTTPAPITTTA